MAGRWVLLADLLPSYARTAWEGLARRGPGGRRRVVQGVVLGDAGVLLAVRSHLRGWELPGGSPRPDESDEEALRREVREETGLEVAVGRPVGEYVRTGIFPHVAAVYACRPLGGGLQPGPETPRVCWFPTDRVPDTLFPWFREPLLDALAGHSTPVARRERQGLGAVLSGALIDLRMRWTGDGTG